MNLEQYINALKWHDWDYDFSDDHSVWQRGVKQSNVIYEAQRELDPDFSVWNKYCPAEKKVGKS